MKNINLFVSVTLSIYSAIANARTAARRAGETVKEFYTRVMGRRAAARKGFASDSALAAWGFCTGHEDKMTWILSISTSAALNKACETFSHIDGYICRHCFAQALIRARANLAKKLARNTKKLTSEIIPMENIPVIDPQRWPFVRIESFGDLNNVTQAINYIHIVEKNPDCNVAWWTKRPLVIAAALRQCGYNGYKPSNLNIILSSPELNKETESAFWFVDKTFTVWESEEACKAAGRTVNCGAKSCYICGNSCYLKGGCKAVNEVKK